MKKVLLAGALAVPLPLTSRASAQTDPASSVIATVGNWSVFAGSADSNRYCVLATEFQGGAKFGLDVTANNSSQIEIRLSKPSWVIQSTSSQQQFNILSDDGQNFGGQMWPLNPTTIGVGIGQNFVHQFVHEFTAGSSLRVPPAPNQIGTYRLPAQPVSGRHL
jgi:hypothetical protein